MKNIKNFHMKGFIFLVVKFSIYLNMRVFVMLKFHTTGTSNSVSWRSALCRRSRNCHTGVSNMQQVVVSCHNVVWDMIMQCGDTQKMTEFPIITSIRHDMTERLLTWI